MERKSVALRCPRRRPLGRASTARLLADIDQELATHDVEILESIRALDIKIEPGGSSDGGRGDEWPAVRERILESDILVFGTPIWLGHPSRFGHRVFERMDEFLSEADTARRPITYGCAANIATVGEEDGAQRLTAERAQGLTDMRIAVQGSRSTYPEGEPIGRTHSLDVLGFPRRPRPATTGVAYAVHLARPLPENPYVSAARRASRPAL